MKRSGPKEVETNTHKTKAGVRPFLFPKEEFKRLAESATYKIEAGIPVPAVHSRGKYPLGNMAVGDSFSFSKDEKRRLAVYACTFDRSKKVKFVIRGLRIWRIA